VTEELRIKTEMDEVNPVKFEYDPKIIVSNLSKIKMEMGYIFVLYVNNFSGAINIMKEKSQKDTRKIF